MYLFCPACAIRDADGARDADAIEQGAADHCRYHVTVLREAGRGRHDGRQGHVRQVPHGRYGA